MTANASRACARLLALALILASGSASAADPSADELARARALYDQGAALYHQEDYAGAARAFRESLALSGAAALNFNLANCYERLGHLPEARDALRLYRAAAPAGEWAELDARLVSLEERIAAATPPEAAPVQPSPASAAEIRRPHPWKWPLFGIGATLGVGGGALTTWAYLQGLDAREAGDRPRYETDRLLNQIGWGVAAVGTVTAVVGLALPHVHSTVDLTALPTPDGLAVAASTRW